MAKAPSRQDLFWASKNQGEGVEKGRLLTPMGIDLITR